MIQMPRIHMPMMSRPRPMPSASQMSAGVRFGACVNAGTAANVFQDLLINNSWAERYHAIASAGRAQTNEIAGVLVKLISGDDALYRVINDPSNKAQKFTLLSMVENFKSGKLSEEMKKKFLEAVEKAKSKKYMRDKSTQEVLDWAMKEMKGEHHVEQPAAVSEAQREYEQHRGTHTA